MSQSNLPRLLRHSCLAAACLAALTSTCAVAATSSPASAASAAGARSQPAKLPPWQADRGAPVTHRLVVRWKRGQMSTKQAAFLDGRPVLSNQPLMAAPTLAPKVGAARVLRHFVARLPNTSIVELDRSMSMAQARAVAAELARDARVASVEPDVRVQAASTGESYPELPNDTGFAQQWALRGAPYGSAHSLAWAQATGRGVRVAVLDTGVVPHPDIESKLLPGYDFITDPEVAIDGNNTWDSDPTDPGDYCVDRQAPSSWHGTRVASVIAASAHNGYGIAGASPDVNIVPVRVLGRCGGWMSDVAAGVAWAAGATVPNAPANPYPARILNLSLSGATGCPQYMQDALYAAQAQGAVVVAATGNNARNYAGSPANCSGVLGVGASTSQGDLTTYSNHGSGTALLAPGGGSGVLRPDGEPAIAVSVLGDTTFTGFAEVGPVLGTSFSAPLVASALALMAEANPQLNASTLKQVLLANTRAFEIGTFCPTWQGACGTGILDAQAAVHAAIDIGTTSLSVEARGPQGEFEPQRHYRAGQTLSFKAAAKGGSGKALTYRWEVLGSATATEPVEGDSLTLTVPDQNTPLTVQVTASHNGVALAVQQVQVLTRNDTVMPSAQLPETDYQGTQALAWTLTVPHEDPDGVLERFELVGTVPDGMEFATPTGLQWLNPKQGTYQFGIRAVNIYGEAGPAVNINLTVHPPVASDAPEGGVSTGDSWTLMGLAMLAVLAQMRAWTRPATVSPRS